MGVRNIAVTITGDGSSLNRALLRSAAEVDGFATKVESNNRRTALSWRTAGLAVAAAGVATAVGLTAAGVAAAQFETRMRNVNSIVQGSEAELRSMSASVVGLSRTLPQSANTLAEGLYEISSSGFAGAEGLLVLEKSAVAASAGLSTTDTSARAITSVLNAYGLSAASAGDVSDALFQTVNVGVISFEELAGVLGDVVGTAAAANVDIRQVGAAIATMTLSGISGAEAATSLGRVLQSLLQPSDALATVYGQLGYESGAAALQSKGLSGVLDDIRLATGGNITTLLQLFPEIRAARGALALMSDEGRTYLRVTQALEDENKRLGATKRALAEQMKAAGAQFTILKNQASATAIEIGTRTLPVFLSFVDTLQNLGSEAMPLIQAGISAVTPLLRNLYETGGDVVVILGTMFDAVAPLATGMLALAGAGILAGLTTLSGTIAATTGFLADHRDIVLAVAAVYAASLLPSVAAMTVAFNRFVLTPVILGLAGLLTGAGTAAAGLRALTATMLSFQTVATLGIGIGLFALARGFTGMKNAQSEARQGLQGIRDDFDALNTAAAQQQIGELADSMYRNQEVVNSYDGVLGTLRATVNTTFGDQSFAKAAGTVIETSDAIIELDTQLQNANKNLSELSRTTGLSSAELAKLATQQDIDLTTPFSEGAAARAQVLSYLQDLEKQSGTTSGALQKNAGLDIAAMEALASAIADAQKRTADAFRTSTDVLGTWKPGEGASEVEAATRRIADAERALTELREDQADKEKLDRGDARALARAEEALGDARQDADRARQTQAEGTLEAHYGRMIAQGEAFSRNLQTAVERGLDPALTARLLQQGPEQAGPILEQLVADSSGRLIEMVNNSERALADLNQRVVEQARLTALAVNSTTDELTADLALAMQISAETISQGAGATVQSVADKLQVPAADVLRAAQNFGITLGQTAQAGLNSVVLSPSNIALSPVALDRAAAVGSRLATAMKDALQSGFGQLALTFPKVSPPQPGDLGSFFGQQSGPAPVRRAQGGLMSGPGTTTSDSIMTLLSNREYVQPARVVDYYGVDFMERLRRMQVPRFAGGGLVGPAAAGSYSAPAVVVAGGTTHSRITRHEFTGPIVGLTLEQVLAEAEQRARIDALAGGGQ